MFVFEEEESFSWPVRIYKPEGGQKKAHQVTLRYKVIPPEEQRELVRDAMRAREAGDTEGGDADLELCQRVVCGWEKIQTADKAEFPFSDENLRKLLDLPYVRYAFASGYMEATSGRAKKGN